MSSIEIPDSEEDEEHYSKEKGLELEINFNEEERSITPTPHETELKCMVTSSKEHTPKRGTASISSTSAASPNSSDTTTTSPTTANGTDFTDNTKSVRHRARKTQHQPRPTDTDIQFETIASGVDSTTEAQIDKTATPAKQSKVQHEENSSAQRNQIQVAITEMLNEKDMQAQIKKIARERVRCNFLLATYQLPDMNFTLNTSIDTLRNQFLDRLKQRREKARLTAVAKGATVKKTIVKAKQPQP